MGLWCSVLVGGRVFGLGGRMVMALARRMVFERVLGESGLVELVVGGSMSLGGIFLRWRCWCWRGLFLVA